MAVRASTLVVAVATLIGQHSSPARHLLMRSERGRPIVVSRIGASEAARRVLVVGCIHGNEPAGMAVADRLLHLHAPAGISVSVVRDANPDGVAADTRGNLDGVDLNRNFPWRWRPLGGSFDSGPRPLSEPESLALARLVLRVRPTVSVWFHQRLAVVDESGGNLAVERRYARLVGLPLRRLTRYPGSAAGWENHVLPGSTAFVVELPPGSLTAAAADRYARSIMEVAR